MSRPWHLLSGEFPPSTGGVADYTRLLARGLAAAGQEVHVWVPDRPSPVRETSYRVHPLPGGFGPRGLRALDEGLDQFPGPQRLLVQYVPHAYGYRALNLAFTAWLGERHGDELWVMFHEVAFPWRQGAPPAHLLLATGTRLMAHMVARAARRILVSVPAWEPIMRSFIPRLPPVTWLPIPSTLPAAPAAGAPEAVRRQLRVEDAEPLVGHFGTYGDAIADCLERTLVPLLLHPRPPRVLLLGDGSTRFAERLTRQHPATAPRLHALGRLPAEALCAHLSACDVVLQPYPDGVSARRTTAMASLSLGRAMVTNMGPLSEPLWREAPVQLASAFDPGAFQAATQELMEAPTRREALGAAAARFYAETFSLERSLRTLLSLEA